MAGASRPANSGFSSRPLPLIGVRRGIVQCRGHDDAHRTAPLQWRCPMKVFFQGGRGAGFVDSWPEILVPSASNRSTSEWTLVDSLAALPVRLALLGEGAWALDRVLAPGHRHKRRVVEVVHRDLE